MKRLLLLIIPLILAVVLYAGFRTGGYRTGATYPVDFTFEGDLTVDGDLTVSGDVKPGMVSMCIFNADGLFGSGTQNTLATLQYWGWGITSSYDSIVIDSVFVLGYAYEDSNEVDSVFIKAVAARTSLNITIVGNTTDWGPGQVGYSGHTYTSSATIPSTCRLAWTFKPKSESAADKMRLASIILYGHP